MNDKKGMEEIESLRKKGLDQTEILMQYAKEYLVQCDNPVWKEAQQDQIVTHSYIRCSVDKS